MVEKAQVLLTMAHSSTFPAEIFHMVISELSRTIDRRILCPLLVVSRQFYQLIIPFLYESITLPTTLSVYACNMERFSPATTILTSSKLDQFLATISRDQTLGAHVISFINNEYGTSLRTDWGLINRALTHFSRLKRLYLLPPHDLDLTQILPHSVSLTHLLIQYLWTEAIYAFICSQPSLEHISIGRAEEKISLSTLPPAVLPNLTSLTCDGCFLSKLEGSPPIKDLSLRSPLRYIPHGSTVFEILRNVRYLSLPNYVFESFAEHCEQVEFLWISSCDDIKIGFLTRMPSRILKYLRLQPAIIEVDVGDLPWEEFPGLMVIDIDRHIFRGITRIARGTRKEDGLRIRIPHVEEFEHWYEVCMDDFDVRLEEKGDPGKWKWVHHQMASSV
ncbi:hypothetical protein ONZ45_g10613 [Pleurotus djamor]|nr:hypothetical protein ONZ45_g10613 [Pleurotus djamor]